MFNFVLIAFLALLARHCESQLVASDRPAKIRDLHEDSQKVFEDGLVDCNSLEKLINNHRINLPTPRKAIPCHSSARLHSEAHVLDLAASALDGQECDEDYHYWHSTRFTIDTCQKNGYCANFRNTHGGNTFDGALIQGPAEITIPGNSVTDEEALQQWLGSTGHKDIIENTDGDIFGCFNGNVHSPTISRNDLPTRAERGQYTHCNFFKMKEDGTNFIVGCPFFNNS